MRDDRERFQDIQESINKADREINLEILLIRF